METVSFVHASPISRVVWALRLNNQVLWGMIWWITSFFMLTRTYQYQATRWVWLGIIWPWCMHLRSKLNWDTRAFPKMLSCLLSITMLITWELPMWIDASMQKHRNYFWLLAVALWILQCIRLTLAALYNTFWFKTLLVIQTTLKMLSICCLMAIIINASSPVI